MRAPEQFAQVVYKMAETVNIVMLGAQGSASMLPMLVWPEMADAHWRDAVLACLDKSRVSDAQFCPPNEINDWIFKARRNILRIH